MSSSRAGPAWLEEDGRAGNRVSRGVGESGAASGTPSRALRDTCDQKAARDQGCQGSLGSWGSRCRVRGREQRGRVCVLRFLPLPSPAQPSLNCGFIVSFTSHGSYCWYLSASLGGQGTPCSMPSTAPSPCSCTAASKGSCQDAACPEWLLTRCPGPAAGMAFEWTQRDTWEEAMGEGWGCYCPGAGAALGKALRSPVLRAQVSLVSRHCPHGRKGCDKMEGTAKQGAEWTGGATGLSATLPT